ncbi:hypothetical protein EVG20_g4729 [Dentipellis fragilis]|uniref:C3H1-type domain-containing protein n=1 Tax=Dentipellis fragilis TaxID=205917 RepID=A0A4Y9YXR6_9AGAM|nr:hypothetical protein EVG20_g4729 [Dentipellis fragilis]
MWLVALSHTAFNLRPTVFHLQSRLKTPTRHPPPPACFILNIYAPTNITTMNRPRESVLSLFDPLSSSNGVATPRRDVHSPDSGSDKENSLPAASSYTGDSPVTLTKFFSRTYTRYKTLPAKLPKGGLIDFGDITITEDTDLENLDQELDQEQGQTKEGEEEMSEDNSEPDENDNENENENTPPASAAAAKQATPHRRPLADIAIEDDENTPIAINRGLNSLKPQQGTIPAPVFSESQPTAAPVSSPLAAVINSINGTSSSPDDFSASTACTPRISIIPPEPSSPSPRGARARPANATSTSSLDPRRTSVDLQSSFSMQLQCSDSSFDLLNGKISFAGHETFLGVMDDFDVAAEEATMLALAQRLENVSLKEKSAVKRRAMQRMVLTDSESESEAELVGSLAERIRDVKLSVSDSESEDENAPPRFSPRVERESRERSSSKSAEATPQAPMKQKGCLVPKTRTPPVRPSELSRRSPTEPASHSNPSLSTPKNASGAPKNPPAIAALRIVKKAPIRPHERTESSSASSATSASSAGISAVTASSSSSAPPSDAPATVVPPLTSRLATRPTRSKTVSSVRPAQQEPRAEFAFARPELAKAELAKAPSRAKTVLVGNYLRKRPDLSAEPHGHGHASASEAPLSSRYTSSIGHAPSSRAAVGAQRPSAQAVPETKDASAPISAASKLKRTASVSSTLTRRAHGATAGAGTAPTLMRKPSTTSVSGPAPAVAVCIMFCLLSSQFLPDFPYLLSISLRGLSIHLMFAFSFSLFPPLPMPMPPLSTRIHAPLMIMTRSMHLTARSSFGLSLAGHARAPLKHPQHSFGPPRITHIRPHDAAEKAAAAAGLVVEGQGRQGDLRDEERQHPPLPLPPLILCSGTDARAHVQKNKSVKVQRQVAQIQAQASQTGKSREALAKEKEKEMREKAKLEDEKRRKEEAALLKPVQQQKVPFGVDPKTVLCAFFKAGHCDKGTKCKFSHDLDVGRKVEKKNLYEDAREEKLNDTMDKWDEEKLRNVVLSKAGNPRTTTDIVCKYFIEAIEMQKFGWFWQCPSGENCQYRHALPPGFVLKSQRKALAEAEKANTISIEEFLEVERHKLGTNLTPVTRETFAKWKATRMDKKAAEEEAARNAKDTQHAAGKNAGMSGRDLFQYNPEWFEDSDEEDEEDWDLAKYRREQEDRDVAEEEERIRNLSLQNGESNGDADGAADGDGDGDGESEDKEKDS